MLGTAVGVVGGVADGVDGLAVCCGGFTGIASAAVGGASAAAMAR